MRKVTKAHIKSLIVRKGKAEVLVVPHKVNIKSPWTNTTKIEFKSLEEFESYINHFELYNCNNREVGFYPAYYID